MIKRFTVVLELLHLAKHPVGKTFLQKAIYVLQDWLNLDLDYDYRLYLYGPYSEDLSDDIEALSETGLIDIVYGTSGYGCNIAISEKGNKFLAKHLATCMVDEGKLYKAIDLVGVSDVRNMELVSTILYIAKTTKDEAKIVELMEAIKPQFEGEEIIKKVGDLQKEKFLMSS